MFQVPFHPMLVHFPIVFSILIPGLAVAAWHFSRSRPELRRKLWVGVAAGQLLFFVSALASSRTGEGDEERVEEAVPHEALHEHEEAGERVVWISGVGVGLAVLPAVVAPAVSAPAFVIWSVLGAGMTALAGKAGGELVYVHGAAQVHVPGTQAGSAEALRGGEELEDEY